MADFLITLVTGQTHRVDKMEMVTHITPSRHFWVHTWVWNVDQYSSYLNFPADQIKSIEINIKP